MEDSPGSIGSSGSSRRERSLGGGVNPVQVYDFALRCAIRAWFEHAAQAVQPKPEKHDRMSAHLTRNEMVRNVLERFKDESDPNKLTRETVRSLLHHLDDIRKGKDTSKEEYSDRLFIKVITITRKHVQQHRYRPSGTTNSVISFFVETCESELKEANRSDTDDLSRFTACFTDIMVNVLRQDVSAPAISELMDTFSGLLRTNYLRPKSKRQQPEKPASTPISHSSIETVEQYSMVCTVKELFQVNDKEHSRKLEKLQSICTVPYLLSDLRKCIDNVDSNQPFPASQQDFPSQIAYDNWHDREIMQLNGFIKSLQVMHPEFTAIVDGDMTHSNTQPESPVQKRRSLSVILSNRMFANKFIFIPSDPATCFRILLNMCIDYDTNVSPKEDRAKHSVLSLHSDELLRECWKTWRLSVPFRSVLYLELILSRYERNEAKLTDVKDAVYSLEKVVKENDVSLWLLADSHHLLSVTNNMSLVFSAKLNDAISKYWKLRPEWVTTIARIMEQMYSIPIYPKKNDTFYRVETLAENIERAAVERWNVIEKRSRVKDQDELSNLLNMSEMLVKELLFLTERLCKLPLLGMPSIPSLVMERQMPCFALEIENWAIVFQSSDDSIETIFALYRKVLGLKRLYDQYGLVQKTVLFKVESWFLPHVRQWLKTAESSTSEWVDNAILQDKLVPLNDTIYHSSSVVDLFSLFHQAVEFLHDLQWPNEYQRCRFMTALSKTISVALIHYTEKMEDIVRSDIYPPAATTESSSLLHLARTQLSNHRLSTIQTKEDNTLLDITPRICICMNNIETARQRLDHLYQMMDVDYIIESMRDATPAPQEKAERVNFLYTVKIIRAENLQPIDNNSLLDPYVVLEINNKQVSRTRVCRETLNPRWDEMFDIWLTDHATDVLAVVYDQDMFGKNEECGGVWFKLSREYFDDYQTHELSLDLHPQGKLILRVNMEGEKDDIQFWFGKSLRSLRRADTDSTGLIADKVGRFIRASLSRKTLDRILGRDRGLFSAFSRTSKFVEPSLQDCERAIDPLIDYLERNLKILNDNLSESNMRDVVLEIWREVILSLESVLLPPLSDQLSDMKPLDDYEFHVVFKWLELLKILFNGGEDGDAVPVDQLENSDYYALLAINVAYNQETDELIHNYYAQLKSQATARAKRPRKVDRSRSLYHSKSTIRRKKAEPKPATIELPSNDALLRILRMRHEKRVREFLHEEFTRRNNPPLPPPHATARTIPPEPKPDLESDAPPPVPLHKSSLVMPPILYRDQTSPRA